MRNSGQDRPIAAVAVLAVSLASVVASWGCEWDESTDKRFAVWKETVNESIEKASSEKEKCDKRQDNSSKEACYKEWDALLSAMLKAKLAGATAYLQCDGSTLDKILELVQSLIKAVDDLADKRKKFQLGGGSVASNFADPLDDAPICLRIQTQEILRQGQRHTYRVIPGSHVAVSFDDGATFDSYPTSGQIVLDIFAEPTVAHCTLIDMDLVLDFEEQGTCSADLHVTDDPEVPTTFDLPVQHDGSFDGRLAGWLDYALENWTLAGSYSTSLPVHIDTQLVQLSLMSQPCEPSSNVFPEDPWPTGPYIYYASLSSDLRLGQDASIEVHGVEPGATVDFYGSPHLVHPTGTFDGAPWDLRQIRQQAIGSAVADADGVAAMTFRMPPTIAAPQDRTIFFQGLAHESGGNRSTIAFSAPVLP